MTKPATTYDEQLHLLESRGIVIQDKEHAKNFLSVFNYYRLTAYMLPFKNGEESYQGVTFTRICAIYEFDRKLRSLIVEALEEIELYLRTKIAYYHAHKYGALGYLNKQNFIKKYKPEKFEKEFNKFINANINTPFVMHHVANKNSEFPIWVAVELFPFGMLSRFYDDMLEFDRKEIARVDFHLSRQHLESWLLCLSSLRNRCAHYMRLYYFEFSMWPKSVRELPQLSNKLYDYVLVMKRCYPSTVKWNSTIMPRLSALIEDYEDAIELSHIGFPDNWEDILRSI